MPNIELLEKSMPVAPIRIAALDGCQELDVYKRQNIRRNYGKTYSLSQQ